MKFEWDAAKAKKNLQKHGISFEEAITLFADWQSLTIPDPEHSEGEARFLILGASSIGRILVESHTEPEENIRIISARSASARKRSKYAQQA